MFLLNNYLSLIQLKTNLPPVNSTISIIIVFCNLCLVDMRDIMDIVKPYFPSAVELYDPLSPEVSENNSIY